MEGGFIAELKRFIERLRLMEEDSRLMKRRLIALRQNMRDAWADGGSGLPGADFTGQVNGCSSHGYPGAQVEIKDPSTGAVIQTLTANSAGAFSGTLALSSGTSQTVNFVATPTGTHAAKFVGPVTQSMSLAEGANTVPTITLLPASGFVCGPTNYFPDATCLLSFRLSRSNLCPAVGATVDFIAGGSTVFSGTTDINGACNFTSAVAGTVYTINWAYFADSGSVNFTGCGTANATAALPAGFSRNCTDAGQPPTLFVTDSLGTRECFPNSPIVAGVQSTLQSIGACSNPNWNLVREVGGVTNATASFTVACASLNGYSGTYSGGGAFLIHV